MVTVEFYPSPQFPWPHLKQRDSRRFQKEEKTNRGNKHNKYTMHVTIFIKLDLSYATVQHTPSEVTVTNTENI